MTAQKKQPRAKTKRGAAAARGLAAKARHEPRTRVRAATLYLPESVLDWAAEQARARGVKLSTVLSQLVASGVFRLTASRRYRDSAKGQAAARRRQGTA